MTADKNIQDMIRHIQSTPNVTDEQLRDFMDEVNHLKATVPGEKVFIADKEYPDLKVGQRVKVYTGEEGTIANINEGKTKRYHVLFSVCFGGQYDAWEVTPVAV